MNASIPTEVPQDIEKEMDVLFARIDEMMTNIRRNREEGQKIMAQSREIAEQNVRDLKELRQRIARI
jgi:glutamyl-tRNA reductase